MTKTDKRRTKKQRTKAIRTIVCIIIIIVSYCIASYYDTHYTNNAEITRVEYHDNTSIVFALDEQGHVWEFKADNLACGQMVKLKMFNNHTIAVEDDEVVGAKAVAVIY